MGVLIFLALVMVELLTISQFDSMAAWCILMFTFSGMFTYCIFAGYAVNKVAIACCSLYTFMWGILLLLEPLVDKHTNWVGQYRTIVWFGGISMIFVLLGIYVAIQELFTCTVKVTGTYRGFSTIGNGHKSAHSPKFTYEYNGISYYATCKSSYSIKTLRKCAKLGDMRIWINPKNPNTFVLKRRLSKGSLLMLLWGTACVCATVYSFMKVGM